jgi:hypothetical protein
MTFPVMLGNGKRLFGDGTPTTMLKMIDHKVTAKGTVIATYEPGGTLPAFPQFGPQPSTSPRESLVMASGRLRTRALILNVEDLLSLIGKFIYLCRS